MQITLQNIGQQHGGNKAFDLRPILRKQHEIDIGHEYQRDKQKQRRFQGGNADMQFGDVDKVIPPELMHISQ